MIIPIRCFTCNKILANRWNAYVQRLEHAKQENPNLVTIIDDEFLKNPNYLNDECIPKKILDDLDIIRPCCRKHFLSNVPMIDKI